MFGLVVISAEAITTQAVEAYLSESKALQTQASTSASNIDCLGEEGAEDEVEGEEGTISGTDPAAATPTVLVTKSSSSLCGIRKGEEDVLMSRSRGASETRGSEVQLDGQAPEEAAQISQDLMEQVSYYI